MSVIVWGSMNDKTAEWIPDNRDELWDKLN